MNKGLEYITKKHLSHSSMRLLSESQRGRWDRYVKKIFPEDQSYFIVGKAVHACIQGFNNTGIFDREVQYTYIKSKSTDEQFPAMIDEFDNAMDNYEATNPIRADKSEYTLSKEYEYKGSKYNIMGIVDARLGNTAIDYKTVTQFTDIENDWKNNYKWYQIQAGVYMILEELNGTPIEEVIFKEIKKGKSSLMACRKKTLVEMAGLPEEVDKDRKITKEFIIKQYNLQPIGVNDIIIKNTPKLIKNVKSIIEHCIDIITDLKEDTLQAPLYELLD